MHKGFSLVDAVSICPTYFGRKTTSSPIEMLKWQREHAISVNAAEKLSPDKLKDKFLIGKFYASQEPEYTEEYGRLIEKAQKQVLKQKKEGE